MKNTTPERRYFAQPLVKETIVGQGRKAAWIGSQIGISKFQMSHVLAGRRGLSENQAKMVSIILGMHQAQLFWCSDEHYQEAA